MQQPPAQSALWRALYPEEHDQSGVTRRLDEMTNRLELVMVAVVQLQTLTGNQTGKPINESDWPTRFEQIVSAPGVSKYGTEADIIASMEEIDRRMAELQGG
jgi:hypothetical protein